VNAKARNGRTLVQQPFSGLSVSVSVSVTNVSHYITRIKTKRTKRMRAMRCMHTGERYEHPIYYDDIIWAGLLLVGSFDSPF